MNTAQGIKSFALYILQIIVMLATVLTLLFFLQRLTGDPAAVLAGHSSSPEVLEAIREEMGLNEPIWVQYGVFIRKASYLDFGESTRFQQPAIDLVLQRLPNTLLLSMSALSLAVIVGVPLGVYAAIYHRRFDGHLINLTAGVLQSMPSFWLGLLLLLFFSVKLQWVGTVSNLEPNLLKRLILPTFALSTFYMARLVRLVRSGMLEELGEDYILTARSKGLFRHRVLFIHAFRNALIPVVALIALDLSLLVGGSFVIETLFSYSGIGDQMVNAIFNRDYALVQATVFVVAILVFTVNSAANVVFMKVDPRIRVA